MDESSTVTEHLAKTNISTLGLVIESFSDADITDAMLQEASDLFSSHYGIWSRNPQCAEQLSRRGLKPGMYP